MYVPSSVVSAPIDPLIVSIVVGGNLGRYHP